MERAQLSAVLIMLDQVLVFRKSGVALWSHSWVPVKGNPVNGLISEILLEVRHAQPGACRCRTSRKASPGIAGTATANAPPGRSSRIFLRLETLSFFLESSTGTFPMSSGRILSACFLHYVCCLSTLGSRGRLGPITGRGSPHYK